MAASNGGGMEVDGAGEINFANNIIFMYIRSLI